MPRNVRILLALVAVGLTVAGVIIGRFGAARELDLVFTVLASLKVPVPADLGEGIGRAMQAEMLGESLLGLGLVLWVVLGAQIGRTSVGFTVAAALVTLAAVVACVFLPVTRLPAMVYLRAPSNEWPYGIVSLDKQHWNAFIIRSPQNEWAVSIERGSPLGPEGVKNSLLARFKPDGSGKRPVRLYLEQSCPDETQKIFIDAAKAACDSQNVSFEEVPLPDKGNFQVLRRIRRDEQLSVYRDILEYGILAHLATAAALAFVVWWTPRKLRGASLVTGGNLLLAFGQAVALPVALYAAMLPDETGTPDYKQILTHLKPHLWIVYASSGALVAGALTGLLGHVVTPTEPPEEPWRPKAGGKFSAKPGASAGEAPTASS